MNDSELMQLFQQGSAPERDAQFGRAVAKKVRLEHAVARLLICIQLCILAGIALGIYMLSSLLGPLLVQVSSATPNLISIPIFHVVSAAILLMVAYWRRPVH